MAPNREVAILAVVKMLGLSTGNCIAGQRYPLLAKCSYIHQADIGESVCVRLAENPPFKDLTAGPVAGIKRKLASSSRHICKSKPNIANAREIATSAPCGPGLRECLHSATGAI